MFLRASMALTLTAAAALAADYTVEPGTKIPLSLINTISTKHSTEGDRVYLETSFPILAERAHRDSGGQLCGWDRDSGQEAGPDERPRRVLRPLRFPHPPQRRHPRLPRPHGRRGRSDIAASWTNRKARSRARAIRPATPERRRGGRRGRVGSIAGSAAGSGMGAGIGAAAGAAAGLIGVLATRGPDAVLARGSTVEMVLDRPVTFDESDLNFGGYQRPRSAVNSAAPATSAPRAPHKRWPLVKLLPALLPEPLDEVRVERSRLKIRIRQDLLMQRDRRVDSLHDEHAQRALHAARSLRRGRCHR